MIEDVLRRGPRAAPSAPRTRPASSTRPRPATLDRRAAGHDDRLRPVRRREHRRDASRSRRTTRPRSSSASSTTSACRTAARLGLLRGRRSSTPAVPSASTRCGPRDEPANVDPTPASHAWTVKPLPDTTIVGRRRTTRPTARRDLHVRLRPAGVTFECTLDDAVDGRELHAVRLRRHLHRPRLRRARVHRPRGRLRGQRRPDAGRVRVGGRDRAAADRRSSPGRTATTESRSATFVFSAGRDFIYECSLDNGELLALHLAEDLQRAAAGRHTFQVRVFDPEAATEPEIGRYTWAVVDLTAPETAIDFGPAARSDEHDRRPSPSAATTRRDLRVLARRRTVRAPARRPLQYTNLAQRLAHARGSARSTASGTSTRRRPSTPGRCTST